MQLLLQSKYSMKPLLVQFIDYKHVVRPMNQLDLVLCDRPVIPNGAAKPNPNPTFGVADLRNCGSTPPVKDRLKITHCASTQFQFSLLLQELLLTGIH